MGSNLDKLFKTNESEERDGIWFDISEDTGFRLRRFGGANDKHTRDAFTQFYKPYTRQIENKTLAPTKEKQILIKIFIHSCLVEWKGVELDGKEAECTPENALRLFTDLPELYKTLSTYAESVDSFKESLGND